MSQWAEIRHLHLVEGVPKKEIARRLRLDVKTVHRAVGRQTPPVRVSPAAAERPGAVAGADRAVAARGPADDSQTDSPVAAAVGRTGLPAHGTPLRRGAEDGGSAEVGLRAPQHASRQDHGGRLRRVVGRHRRSAVQGQVPGGDAAVQLFYALTTELAFEYVIRLRGDIYVTNARGERRAAAAWVGAGGRVRGWWVLG